MPREDPRVHGTRQWLVKAAEDLGLAELLVRSASFPSATVYHCQQAAEKVLKAFSQTFRQLLGLILEDAFYSEVPVQRMLATIMTRIRRCKGEV